MINLLFKIIKPRFNLIPVLLGILVVIGVTFYLVNNQNTASAQIGALCSTTEPCTDPSLECVDSFCRLKSSSGSQNSTESTSASTATQQTQTTQTPPPANVDISLYSCLTSPISCSIAGILGIFNYIATYTIDIFVYVLTSFSVQTSTPEAIFIIWRLMNNFVSMFFIIIFIVMAYATIFNNKAYSFQNLIGPLFAVAILLNFTYIIPVNVIAVGDQITNAFVQPIQGGLKTTLSGSLIFAQLLDSKASSLDLLSKSVVSIIFSIIITVIFFILIFFLLARLLIAWAIIIMAPIAAFAYIIPGGRSLFDRWTQELTSWAFFPAVYTFILYFGVTILAQKSGLGNFGGTTFLGLNLADIIFFIFATAILIGGLIFAKTIGGFFGLKTSGALATFESKIGLTSLLDAGKKGDVKGFARGLGAPFQAIGGGADKILSKTPVVSPIYRGIKQGVSQRAIVYKDQAKRAISTSTIGRLATGQGNFTAERLAGYIGGADSTAAKGAERKTLVDKTREKIQEDFKLDRFKDKPIEQQKELERLKKQGTDYQKQAAQLMLLENRLALGEKIGIDEATKILNQFGGDKTELGKELNKKLKGKIDIEKDLRKKAIEELTVNNPNFDPNTDEGKDAIEKRLNEFKQNIALGKDPDTEDLKELRKLVSEDLVKNGKIQGEDETKRKEIVDKLASELYLDADKLKFLDNVKFDQIFKGGDNKLDIDKLAKFASTPLAPNATEFQRQLQKKAMKEVLKEGYFTKEILEDANSAKAKTEYINGLLSAFEDRDEKKEVEKSININKIFKTDEERREALNNEAIKGTLLDKLLEDMGGKDISNIESLNTALARLGGAKTIADFRNKENINKGRATDKGDNIIKKFSFKDNIKKPQDLKALLGDGDFKTLEDSYGEVFTGKLLSHLSDNIKALDAETTKKVEAYYAKQIEEAGGAKKAKLEQDLASLKKEIEKSHPLLLISETGTERVNKIKELIKYATPDELSKYDSAVFDDNDFINEFSDMVSADPSKDNLDKASKTKGKTKKVVKEYPQLNKLREIKKEYDKEVENIKNDAEKKLEELDEAIRIQEANQFDAQAIARVNKLKALGFGDSRDKAAFINKQLERLNNQEQYKNIDSRIIKQQALIERIKSSNS